MPIDIRDIRLRQEEQLDTREVKRDIFPAITIAINGSVIPPNQPGKAYVRPVGTTKFQPQIVYNPSSIEQSGVPVIVGPDPRFPYGYTILRVNQDGGAIIMSDDVPLPGQYTIPPHRLTHQWTTEANKGSDAVETYMPALQPLKTIASGTGLTVSVKPYTYTLNGARRYFQGVVDLDLSSSVPNIGYSRYVLLYLHPTLNTIVKVDGDEALTGSYVPYPTLPAGRIASSYVLLTGGQTIITQADNIIEGRDLFGLGNASGSSPSSGATTLGELTDVNVTGIVDGETISYDSSTGTYLPTSFLPIAGGEMFGPIRIQAEVVAAAGSSYAIDMEITNVFDITMDQNCTFTLDNPPDSGTQGSFALYLKPEGNTPTFSGPIVWTGANTITTTTNTRSIIQFTTIDGGATYYATLVGTGLTISSKIGADTITLDGSAESVTAMPVSFSTLSASFTISDVSVGVGSTSVVMDTLTIAGSTETIDITNFITPELVSSAEDITVVPGATSVVMSSATITGYALTTNPDNGIYDLYIFADTLSLAGGPESTAVV